MKYIETYKITPHPENPRKDLGDLTELAESIKENGVLQNLTVIPNPEHEDRYIAVIGHRRLAAAAKAGLYTVPCVVKEMDYKTQIGTMLLENMQRGDLTPYEQAQGFQMMMDLGETVSSISKQTGLSETTVRHRVKLTELDQELLREKAAQNITMAELIKLEKIKDPDSKNSLLEKIGTSNFDYHYNAAIRDQEAKEKADELEELFATFAEKREDNEPKDVLVYMFRSWHAGHFEMPDDVDEREYYYVRADETSLTLYGVCEETDDEEDDEEDGEEEIDELDERRDKLADICETMQKTRMNFMKELTVSMSKATAIHKAAVRRFAVASTNRKLLMELIDIKMPEDLGTWQIGYMNEFKKKLEEKLEKLNPLVLLAISVYAAYERIADSTFGIYTYGCVYQGSTILDEMYSFLIELGYQISDEEQKILGGTHELYVEGKKNDVD